MPPGQMYQYYFVYPSGCAWCHFHADAIISSRLACTGFQPRTFFAFSLDAISFAGSPPRLGDYTAGIGCPVTLRAVSITSLTVNPTPFPRLNTSLAPPLARYFTASMCASARSVTWI